MTRIGIAVLFLGNLLAAAEAHAQLRPSRCADCHFANPGSTSSWHLSEWDHSAHGRAQVGCEACHRGNPETFDSFPAHQGMLGPLNPASPIHRMNIPATCGGCHPGPFEAFQKSHHYELLREGNREAPNCVTCHGNAGAFLLSPKALAAECSRCHGPGKVAPMTDHPADGRIHLEAVREVRESLDEAGELIKRVREKERRARLDLELRDARDTLVDAVHAAHMFVFTTMDDRLEAARKRADLLREELANPQAPARK